MDIRYVDWMRICNGYHKNSLTPRCSDSERAQKAEGNAK